MFLVCRNSIIRLFCAYCMYVKAHELHLLLTRLPLLDNKEGCGDKFHRL